MDILAGALTDTFWFLVVFTVLVFVHELGHFLVARRYGVGVEVFSIGFGPEIRGWTDSKGTRWKISGIPLGGYVKFCGDSGAASQPDERVKAEMENTEGAESGQWLTPEEREASYHFKPVGQRAAVSAAGPLANLAFAVLVLAGLFMAVGQPFTPAVVGEITPDSAAEAAGFMPGDKVLDIDGSTIERFEDMQQIVRLNAGSEIQAIVLRDGEELVLSATPRVTELTDRFGNVQKIGLLGISRSGVEYVRHGPTAAVWYAARETISIASVTLKAVGQMIAGTRTTEELGGPLRIAKMSGDMASEGAVAVIWFIAVLSINLGLINLFPIPMLDGGHLLFQFFEAVRDRPLNERIQEYGFRIGIAMVLTLMLFATWNDLVNLRVFDFFANLTS